MKRFISNVIEVRKKLGFVYIPAQALQYFPQVDKSIKINVLLDEQKDIENRLTFNPKVQRVFGLRAWLKNAALGDNIEISILDQKDKKYRFKLKKSKKRRKKQERIIKVNEYYTGEPINYKDIKYAPRNEAGVIILWTRLLEELGMDYVTSLSSDYVKGGPDAVVKMPEGKGWTDRFIEFEYKSRNAKGKHDFRYIDYIVCWEHNWEECPVEVIELKSVIMEESEQITGELL